MKAAILIRTGSSPSQIHPGFGSPRGPAADQASGAGVYFLRRSRSTKLLSRSAMHLDAKERTTMETHPNPLRRARSDTDLIGSGRPRRIEALWSPPARFAEVVEEEEEEKDKEGSELDLGVSDLLSGSAVVVPDEEVEYSGGGMGKGRKIGGGRGGEGGDSDEKRKIGCNYQEMLRADPGNPLLLRNYGRFLHEVEGNVARAEEYYGRAILANPRDGEVLSLYGKLLWEAHGDGERAGDYFERAVEASPSDCYVLGSYAKFLWDTEEDDDEAEDRTVAASSPLVKAF